MPLDTLIRLALPTAFALAAVVAGPATAACYTVYDAQDRVVFRDAVPPVDMTRSPVEAVRRRVPDGHLVFDGAADCGPLAPAPGRSDVTGGPAPLFTDRQTVEALGLSHRALPGGVARVDGAAAAMRPGVTVLPLSSARRAADPTRSMGAGPAPVALPAAGTVITEMHNPPLTVVEQGGTVVETGR